MVFRLPMEAGLQMTGVWLNAAVGGPENVHELSASRESVHSVYMKSITSNSVNVYADWCSYVLISRIPSSAANCANYFHGLWRVSSLLSADVTLVKRCGA
jgi:hypothetical protein